MLLDGAIVDTSSMAAWAIYRLHRERNLQADPT
jgi:hypothetical protein